MVIERRCHCFRTIIILVVLAAICGVVFIYSGIYNVSATYKDNAVVEWVMETTLEYSVARHAAGIKAPNLNDPKMIQAGLGSYQGMCLGCHGAPGVSQRASGFNPSPPPLAATADEWKPNEFFWITRNGIRMTGMPAHSTENLSDQDLWAMTAFALKMPTMTPEEFQEMSSKLPEQEH